MNHAAPHQDILVVVVDRALTDSDFLARAAVDLEGTLAAEGYQLTSDELAAVRAFHTQAAGGSDPRELTRIVTSLAAAAGGGS